MTNIEYADSLRQVAAFYEEHPDMPQPYDTLMVILSGREDFIKAARELSKGALVEKKLDKPGGILPEYHVLRVFGGVTIDVRIPRKTVCRLISEAVYDSPDSLLEEGAEFQEGANV